MRKGSEVMANELVVYGNVLIENERVRKCEVTLANKACIARRIQRGSSFQAFAVQGEIWNVTGLPLPRWLVVLLRPLTQVTSDEDLGRAIRRINAQARLLEQLQLGSDEHFVVTMESQLYHSTLHGNFIFPSDSARQSHQVPMLIEVTWDEALVMERRKRLNSTPHQPFAIIAGEVQAEGYKVPEPHRTVMHVGFGSMEQGCDLSPAIQVVRPLVAPDTHVELVAPVL